MIDDRYRRLCVLPDVGFQPVFAPTGICKVVALSWCDPGSNVDEVSVGGVKCGNKLCEVMSPFGQDQDVVGKNPRDGGVSFHQ